MASVGYKVSTSAAVALTGGTARTCLMVITPAQFGGALRKARIGFDGVTASAVPALVEVVQSTNATNSTPGTNNTSETANIFQYKGRSVTAGFTAFSASTAGNEPTALTVMDSWLLTPAGGLVVYDFPLGDEIECNVSAGLGVRINAPANVNARVSLSFERL
jgi:hypothetical protein